MESIDPVFRLVGEVVAYGGGGAVVAYLLFQYFGKRWIENKFDERLESQRHVQARELQRLRFQIDTALSATVRLQEKEFEVLPDAWAKLDEAYLQLARLVSPLQQYPDLDRYSTEQLEEFLERSELRETQKNDIRASNDKFKTYQEIYHWQRLGKVRESIAHFHQYVERNSIFLSPDLKDLFERASDKLWSAMTDKEVGHEVNDRKMQSQGWTTLKAEVEPLRKSAREAIYSVFQGHRKWD